MATATKTRKGGGRKPKQQLPSQATFIARAANHRLVADPLDVVRNERGQVIRTYPGSAVEFRNHRVTVKREDKILYRGEEIPTIEFLRNHPAFNVDFWELGNAPDSPKPTVEEQKQAIYEAAAERDVLAISAVVEEEKATHNRPEVLSVAEAALIAIAADTGKPENDNEGEGEDDKKAE